MKTNSFLFLRVIALAVFAMALFTNCATLSVTTGGEIFEPSGRKVSTEVTNFNILGFTPMIPEKIDLGVSDLSAKCPGKKVINVTSQEKFTYAFVGVYTTLTIQGYCAD